MICFYISVHIYIYIYVFIYLYVFIYSHVDTYIYIYIHMNMFVCVPIWFKKQPGPADSTNLLGGREWYRAGGGVIQGGYISYISYIRDICIHTYIHIYILWVLSKMILSTP